MRLKKLKKIVGKLGKLGLLICGLAALTSCTESSTIADRLCTYQPPENSENVLGKDARFVIQEQGGNTTFTYQPLPSLPIAENIQLSAKRELIFANTDFDTARVILLQNSQYFTQLVGEETEKGFEAVNELLTCE